MQQASLRVPGFVLRSDLTGVRFNPTRVGFDLTRVRANLTRVGFDPTEVCSNRT